MEGSADRRPPVKDPRVIARKYQVDLCKKAVEENIIVYLGTGCGKTHIAVLLMYELGHLFRKPRREVCIFLAPSVPLVRQQAIVIENSTDFKVQCYFGDSKHLKNHDGWEKEVQIYEVLVMTPQILLQNLRHCLIKMELVALLIFDECHHAQVHKRHPYAQIMKEFYKKDIGRYPRIFGMTASPIIGKGGCNQLNYSKFINSLEDLLDAKVCAVDDDAELESVSPSPDIKVYLYQRVIMSDSNIITDYFTKLEEIKNLFLSMIREKTNDLKEIKKSIKLLLKIHDNLIYCLENIGIWGAMKAVQLLLKSDGFDLAEVESNASNIDRSAAERYMSNAASVFNCSFLNDGADCDRLSLEALQEPFFSKKLLVLIGILQKYREKPNINCIIFVRRIIAARTLTYILSNMKCLDFWQCEFLVGFHSGSLSRKMMDRIVERFCSGEVNLLVATNVAEEGLDIQTCCLVIRFDLPETVASFIQSRGRARMTKSEYAFLVERGNQREERLLDEFKWGENTMNEEIIHRTSSETFDNLEEASYTVNATGASITTGCSVSVLHRYCSKLPHDRYFRPLPKFFYIDDVNGTVCRIILPSNSPLRQVDSLPCRSKDKAKRTACLKACVELHKLGALTDYLLPDVGNKTKAQAGATVSNSAQTKDDNMGYELCELLVPKALQVRWSKSDIPIYLNFYCIKFTPIPNDREYRKFGLFIKVRLPKEAEAMEVDLHLSQGRIVKSGLMHAGILTFSEEEIVLAQKFQELSLKIILDREDYIFDCVSLGMDDCCEMSLSTFYLLLPILHHGCSEAALVDWQTVRSCLSSPIFSHSKDFNVSDLAKGNTPGSLVMANGPILANEILNSLVFTPLTNVFYFIDDILYDINGYSKMRRSENVSYCQYYTNKFRFDLSHPEQPMLKAKQLFNPRNLLHDRLQGRTEIYEMEEHFVELPPEICCLKIFGFSKDIGSSLSLLPSFLHRLENLLVAVELKNVFSTSFPEGSEITASRVLESLTTEKCLERFSLERLEVLGDSFLKYVIGRYTFLSYEGFDEGQLTCKRSGIVNNSHLYDLAIGKNLQVYICDESFDPANFFALGRPCRIICNQETESNLHPRRRSEGVVGGMEPTSEKCSKFHRWLYRKTIADAVEALIGAFLVDTGFRGAIAFLTWLGIKVDYDVRDVQRICEESRRNLSLINDIDITTLETLLGYTFRHKGLLLQAFIHPSYTKHSGGCYQRLEFLGDAVLEYLITSYVYSVYPQLNPGQLTDLRSITVNNNSFAQIAVSKSFHAYLMSDSKDLTEAVKKFERYATVNVTDKDMLKEPVCPKVLGDIVESCIGAILLDSGFDLKRAWRVMLSLLDEVLRFSNFDVSPIRELREFCQFSGVRLMFPKPIKETGRFTVKVLVEIEGQVLVCKADNSNTKAARRTASQEMLRKLKALGYRHKSKTLEEVLRTTRKEKAELIGFNETPVVTEITDEIQLEKLQLKDPEVGLLTVLPHQGEGLASSTPKAGLHKKFCFQGKSGGAKDAEIPEIIETTDRKYEEKEVEGLLQEKNGSNNCRYATALPGSTKKKSAKSHLFEICASNYWKPPSFECCKEEGHSHLKTFTYKVTVVVEGIPDTVLECFGEPRQKKKAAEEHAAEGALWCLKHKGHA